MKDMFEPLDEDELGWLRDRGKKPRVSHHEGGWDALPARL